MLFWKVPGRFFQCQRLRQAITSALSTKPQRAIDIRIRSTVACIALIRRRVFNPRAFITQAKLFSTIRAGRTTKWKLNKSDLVIYEAHIGTLTREGTFLAAIDRLDELVDLGVTAIELMPLAAAGGRWNWGYDGVSLFAPSANYGSPGDLCKLIDAAHEKGLAMFLDVVYNHLGPEGNYLGDFGRSYFSKKHKTPWGEAPNFDDPKFGCELRRFFVANAIYWLDEFHFDGLRVDAIHCMKDDSETHVAVQISQAIRQWSAESGRDAMLIAESNVYDPNMLDPIENGGGRI